MQIDQFDNEQKFLYSVKEKNYDLVILDIYMKRITGDRLAQFIREQRPDCQIIFTTASREHAVGAFKVRALDYLVKPYTYEELENALDRFEEVYDKFLHYIELKEGRQYTRILITDIMYVDYHNHYIQVHTTSNVVRSYMPFDKFAPSLQLIASSSGVTETVWLIWTISYLWKIETLCSQMGNGFPYQGRST